MTYMSSMLSSPRYYTQLLFSLFTLFIPVGPMGNMDTILVLSAQRSALHFFPLFRHDSRSPSTP